VYLSWVRVEQLSGCSLLVGNAALDRHFKRELVARVEDIELDVTHLILTDPEMQASLLECRVTFQVSLEREDTIGRRTEVTHERWWTGPAINAAARVVDHDVAVGVRDERLILELCPPGAVVE
jgi:hypothetical protein